MINKPGVREKDGGLIIQFRKRSLQLEGIANTIDNLLSEHSLPPNVIRKINGYTEQLRIIADEISADVFAYRLNVNGTLSLLQKEKL